MSPQIKAWREAVIKYCALRLRYLRAWQTGRANICDLAVLLSKVEEAQEQCLKLTSEREEAT